MSVRVVVGSGLLSRSINELSPVRRNPRDCYANVFIYAENTTIAASYEQLTKLWLFDSQYDSIGALKANSRAC